MTAYARNTWVNDTTPALNATNLNRLTNELKLQAVDKNIPHTLPTWADGGAPAITDASPLNEMERVVQAITTSLGLTAYVPTTWGTGWTPARNATRLNRMEAQAVITRNAIDAAGPPPTGVLRDTFTDFYTQWGYSASDHNGQIFQNRWNTTNLQTLSSTQTPWSSIGGPAISEFTDGLGRPGFRFICNTQTQDDSGNKKVEIYESNGAGGSVNPYGEAMIRGVGFTDEISFTVRFPSAGNPSGFPGPNEGVFDRRNVFWQHSMDPSELNYFGISRLGFTNRFFLSIGRHISTNSENFGFTMPWEVLLDTYYDFRYIIKWSSTSGTFQWWVKRPTDSVAVQYANYSGQTWWAIPNTEFGFYSAVAFTNTIEISDIRVTAH